MFIEWWLSDLILKLSKTKQFSEKKTCLNKVRENISEYQVDFQSICKALWNIENNMEDMNISNIK